MSIKNRTMLDRSSPQTASPLKRFGILDAMILVAATAAGCGFTRWVSRTTEGDVSWSSLSQSWQSFCLPPTRDGWPPIDRGYFLLKSSLILSQLTMPIIATWTLALIPIRLLGPRPRLRRLMRQPGTVATCALALAIMFVGLQVAVAALAIGGEGVSERFSAREMVQVVPMLSSLAVSTSWTTLLASRCWRTEPSWVDRFGRAAGVFWILAGFAFTGLFILEDAIANPCRFYVR